MNTGSFNHHIDPINQKLARNSRSLEECTSLAENLHVVSFEEFAGLGTVSGNFDSSCQIFATPETLELVKSSKLRVKILSMSVNANAISNAIIYIGRQTGELQVLFGSSGTVVIGDLGQARIDARMGHDGVLVIGDKTTINGARFVAVNSNIVIGKDGLWSDEILVQGFDQHGIIDVEDQSFLNLDRKDVVIDSHVWIGRRATLMPGSTVGRGSIIGAASLVTKNIPSFTAAAGNPAKIVRSGVSWSRPWTQVDPNTKRFLDDNSDAIREIVEDQR